MNKELEFLEEKYGHSSWTHYPPSKQQVAQWLKEYAEKQFAICGVVGSLPTEEQIDDKVSRVAASTWGDYGAGYIDGTRNGASWVIDVVNGKDK